MTATPFAGVSLIAASLLWPPLDRSAQSSAARPTPGVTESVAPAGTETLPVTWLRVAIPTLGAIQAAVARPSGPGPFAAVLILHGTHGFARQYVELAGDFARAGFIAVAACWFSGGGGAGVAAVTPAIPCPDIPPLGAGEYPHAVQIVDALGQATRALPGVRADRFALVGHSRGAGAAMQYLLASGDVSPTVLHSSGYALAPWERAAEFRAPLLLMHGTADGPADGGGPNTRIALARHFETALRRNQKSIEAAYCDECGHNTFFTNPVQRDAELTKMIDFLRRHLTP